MVILIQCRDSIGLVAAISAVLANAGINILSMREYVDPAANLFFARLFTDTSDNENQLLTDFQKILPGNASITINPGIQKKIVVLVSKEYHCLGDILVRHHFRTLGAEVQCVIGNHNVLRDICDRFHVPFYFLSHEAKSREDFERDLLALLRKYDPDYLVLAKFMRILSPLFVDKFLHRIINIHHSFLPAFMGANPYRQAYLRGVKLLGATAHFVDAGLDEGPIIEQQIIPVNHTYTAIDMVRAGREIEKAVLAKALQLVCDDRVFVYNNKTIVFDQA